MNNMAPTMGQMNPGMGGPVGAGPGMPMMPNTLGQQSIQGDQRSTLNTYIYDYFLHQGMYACARTLLNSDDIPINLATKASPGRPRENGAGDDSMDTDTKDGGDSKRPDDLPAPSLPESEACFLYEWFCLFWDMVTAQRNKNASVPQSVTQYMNHTQQQNRLRQSQQQDMLRSIRPENQVFGAQGPMGRMMPNGIQMKNHPGLARAAMTNNINNPNAMQMMQKQQREAADVDGKQHGASPGSADNAPSPNKRPRLDGTPFNPQQAGVMANGQRQPGMPANQVGNGPSTSAAHAATMLQQHGIDPAQLTQDQFQSFQQAHPQAQQKSIQTYAQNLQQHHGQQMPNKGPMANNGGPQGQASPMMPQVPEGAAANLQAFYNPENMSAGPSGIRPAPGGGQGAGGSNHALQDYQMQLMLLEQQNKKRLMMARQEQDSMGNMPPRGDGPPGPGGPAGPNGQGFPETSPQGGRPGASPNPTEQMKRGTPQMGPAGIPSPLPEGGGPSRGSPNPMNFMPGNMPNQNMDPSMAQHFFKGNMNGQMDNMAAQMNGGMRPPSSHPNQPFNGQMQANMLVRQQQQQGQGQPGAPGMPWQGGQQNGNGMGPQGPPGAVQGNPQQRSTMPPPSAPGAGGAGAANGRNTTSPPTNTAAPPTPSQTKKAAPKKKDTKNAKAKGANNKANQNAAATPAAEPSQEGETPTPATPITPVNANFAKNGGQQGAGPVPPASSAPGSAPQQPAPAAAPAPSDANQMGGFNNMDPQFNAGGMNGLEFHPDPMSTTDVLQDFDFDSFLHEDGGDSFGFDATAFGMDQPEIQTEQNI